MTTSTKDAYSDEERSILRSLLDSDQTVEFVVPDKIENDHLWSALTATTKAINRVERSAAKLTPILGRILVLIQDRPTVYKTRGYETYEKFLTAGVVETMGVSRATLYAAKRLAKAWPNLLLESYEKITPQKLLTLSRFTSQAEPGHKKYLAKAQKMTLSELHIWAETQGLVAKGATRPGCIVIRTTAERAAMWKAFASCLAVQAKYASAAPDGILEALMQEAIGEYGFEIDVHEEAEA